MSYPLYNESEYKNKQWVETHVLNNGDFVFYGTLYNELPHISSAIFWGEIRKIAEQYLFTKTNRTAIFHERINDQLDGLVKKEIAQGYPPPFCHKGCCNCCYEPVLCTDEEANDITAFCNENNIPIDYDKVERQLKFIVVDDELNFTGETNWNNQHEDDQSCVFLDQQDNSCRIWSVRPFVCRVHLAEKTDKYCRPHNGIPNQNAKAINYLEWSYILTTIFTIHKDSISKTMGRLLLSC